MNKNYRLIIWLGLILIIVPFLGIPQSWKDFVLLLVGLILIASGLFNRNNQKMEEKGNADEKVFVESESPESKRPTMSGDIVPPRVEDEYEEEEVEEDDEEYRNTEK